MFPIVLGAANLIQFLVSLFTCSSMRSRMQASFNDWYRVAEIGDQIGKTHQRFDLIRTVNGIADAACNDIKAYSREHLNFVPYFDPAHQGGPNPPARVGFWRNVLMAFQPK